MLTHQIMQVLLAITVPEVAINQDALQAKNNFTHQVQEIAQPINAQTAAPIVGLAPLGGTKISALKELNLDGLVIIDWDRPGSPETIQHTYHDGDLRNDLISALTESLNNGAMSTSTVMKASISAQILSRLWYEMNVSSVKIQYYLPKNAFTSSQQLSLWDGSVVADEDTPLITRFTFEYQQQPKEIIFISAKVTSDRVTWRHSLPVDILQNLAPQKYQWVYLSADGLIFFSGKEDNGMRAGNQELLSLLNDGAGVVLVYPHANMYTSCDPQLAFDGIQPMCGRGDLEKWGLKNVARLPANQQFKVFGYSGYASNDEIRVYINDNHGAKNVNRSAEIFSLKDFTQVGDAYVFDITGYQSVTNVKR